MELIVRRHHIMMVIAIITMILARLSTTYAYDPSPLQNFCVADYNASVHVNGIVCKDPNLVTADDFMYSGLGPTNTNNSLGFGIEIVDVNTLPGLNTLGISILRSDIAPNGTSLIQLHPRGGKILIVLDGTILLGFVDSTPGSKSRLFSKIMKPGDAFALPIGTLQFLKNVGNTTASVIAVFNTQNLGFVTVSNDVFGTEPSIPVDIIAKAFQLDKKVVEHLQSIAW